MPALITELIDKQDVVEIVRDQIAAILVTELAEQQVLAAAAVPAKDPELWKLRVFVDRSNPWAEFIDAPAQIAAIPIINISLDNENFDGRSSNVVESQKSTAVFNIDCYGYGVSEDVDGGGHIPGDARATSEVLRAVRLVRNILMSAHYAYLAMRGTVMKRWTQSITVFQPPLDMNAVQQITGARLALQVDFREFSPQVQGETIELIAGTIKRAETGEIYLRANYTIAP